MPEKLHGILDACRNYELLRRSNIHVPGRLKATMQLLILSDKSTCLTLLCPVTKRVEIFGNIYRLWQFVICIKVMGKIPKGSRRSCKSNARWYEKLAFFDQCLTGEWTAPPCQI